MICVLQSGPFSLQNEQFRPIKTCYSFSQGLRPGLPDNAHPKLLELMQRSWDAVPSNRPSFSEIAAELENLLKVKVTIYLVFNSNSNVLYNFFS